MRAPDGRRLVGSHACASGMPHKNLRLEADDPTGLPDTAAPIDIAEKERETLIPNAHLCHDFRAREQECALRLID